VPLGLSGFIPASSFRSCRTTRIPSQTRSLRLLALLAFDCGAKRGMVDVLAACVSSFKGNGTE
jgi:hypothetical protein